MTSPQGAPTPTVDPGPMALQAIGAASEPGAYALVRLGRGFLIQAAGRSSSEILAALEDRLGNEPVTELVVGQQLRELALLRLEGRVGQ